MSKKHRHRRRYEEELELCPRNNTLPQNSPQGVEDQSLMLIGLLEMIGSQFNLFGNNQENNNEDISNNVNEASEYNPHSYAKEDVSSDNKEKEEGMLNTTVDNNTTIDSIVETGEYDVENNADVIIEDVKYEIKENSADAEEGINKIDNMSDTSNEDNIENIYNKKELNNINDINSLDNVENLNEEYNICSTNYVDNTNNECDIDGEIYTEFKCNNVIVKCKATASSNSVVQSCSNENKKTKVSKEPVVSKIPVIISQIEVPIYIETVADLKEPVFKIIDVSNEVFLESCHLINNSNKLFIKGFIKENITYTTVSCITPQGISGTVKNLEVQIPFKCSTSVHFTTTPISNEKVSCKMDSINISETINQEETKLLKNTLPETYTFKGLRKKIVLNLGLSLLQDQNVFVDK